MTTARAGDGAFAQSAAEVEDIGEIEAGEGAPSKFRLNVSTRAEYLSNARLSGNHSSSDFLVFPGIEAGFNTTLGRGFSLDAVVKVESGIYVDHDERSFIGYSGLFTLDWRPRPNLPRIYISAEPYRYDRFDTGDLITQAFGLSVGTDWGFGFNAGKSLFFVGYTFTEYLSDPSIDDRTQHRAVIGVTHQIKPQLYAQLSYQFSHSDYDIARRDSRHGVVANLIWQVNRHLFASLSGSFVDNDSTQFRASYQSATIGVGLTWQF